MHWLYLLLFSVFCFWVIFRDGAERLEGWFAAVVFDLWAAVLSANLLRLYAGIIWGVWLLICIRAELSF